LTLRKHQEEVDRICRDILSGKRVKTIIASVTPGGGKSALPVIIAQYLLGTIADRLLWVVPRNSLKYQGEAEFVDPRWESPYRIRAADGNSRDLTRGSDGYITTYQAIGMDANIHRHEASHHRYILFLDEPHHVSQGSLWHRALSPLVDAAALVVLASGTFIRADGKPVAFLDEYKYRDDTEVVTYSRSDALSDGAIAPVHFRTLDGEAEWENEDGSSGSVSSIQESGDYAAQALFTALRTEYAEGLLDQCYADWIEERKRNERSQLLIVSPNIEEAKRYQSVMRRRMGIPVPIATSADTPGARKAIAEYKRGVHPALVTVAMAYEGLSVPAITHIACLTHIRSVPWLEQCFARANRLCPGKTAGYVYGPADPRFLDAIGQIESEQVRATDKGEKKGSGESEVAEGGNGSGKPWINPIRSQAEGITGVDPLPFFTPSDGEKAIRDQISAIRKLVLSRTRAGSERAKIRIFSATVKAEGKKLDEMNQDELYRCLERVRERFKEVIA